MSATLSEATGRPYGIQRVCQAWERSRSALYARQTREQQRHKGAEPARRGPTPTVSDATLLEAIQADLDRSPFQGEGHRKVHARLRILDGIRVARTRVLRVMRAHKLLSPHRGRQGAARVHAGTIVTQAPNVMWGTDGVRVFTLDDGWGWICTAVEHWNAECVGWHVCKVGSRFAALEPIAQGLRRIYGALDADSARGLALRMDHGSQYLSDHFLNQIRYWGMRPSYGFVEGTGNERRGGAVESHAQGASDPRAHLPEPQGGTRRSDRVRGAVQHDLAAREARVSHADRGPRGARATPGGVALTCVQRTGCGTTVLPEAVETPRPRASPADHRQAAQLLGGAPYREAVRDPQYPAVRKQSRGSLASINPPAGAADAQVQVGRPSATVRLGARRRPESLPGRTSPAPGSSPPSLEGPFVPSVG